LLGSAAAACLRADSDVDVAILPSRRTGLSVEKRLGLTAELAAIFGRAVDLGVLSTANVVYAKGVVTTGRLLCERDRTETARFAMLALSMYASLMECVRASTRSRPETSGSSRSSRSRGRFGRSWHISKSRSSLSL